MIKKLKLDELNRLSVEEYKEAEKFPIVVVMDNVRSMHNVGSVFRTCDAFRISKLFLCGITPTPPQREIHKTALGAEESVTWEYYKESAELVRKLKAENYCIISLEQTENSVLLPNFSLPTNPIALILGHEVEGVAQEIIQISDICLEIPQFGTKHSLNVSVAAGVALYQLINLHLSIK